MVTTITKLTTRPELTTLRSIMLTKNTEDSLPPVAARPMIKTMRDSAAVINTQMPSTESYTSSNRSPENTPLTKNTPYLPGPDLKSDTGRRNIFLTLTSFKVRVYHHVSVLYWYYREYSTPAFDNNNFQLIINHFLSKQGNFSVSNFCS